jgi:hypothetical protein
LQVEPLESRRLLSAVPTPGLSLLGPNDPGDTLDHAAALGDLSVASSARVDAAIGDSPAGAADVDWYAFTLDRPATVALTAAGTPGVAPPVLSLYVRDPSDPADPATLLGVRQLAQAAGTDPASGTHLDRALAAGSYYVAASGAGNNLFNPFLAGSGYDGQTGAYQLQVAATDLGLGAAAGPVVLASTPAPDSSLGGSPTVLRLDLSSAIATTTVRLGDDARLIRNPTGAFGNGSDQSVTLASFHFSSAATELQLTPAAPLAPGYYRLQLGGDTATNPHVLTGPNGTPLGADALHPAGQDFVLTFRVVGVEGNTAVGAAADDTPAGAHDLGDVSNGRLVRTAGVIGDDPTDPVPFDRSDVDLYHFRVSGPGRYAFAAEVFAQRIGSPLNAAVSLFVLDPTTGRLRLLGANSGTQNSTQASDHKTLPLFNDPALFTGLTAGDYYVAVSSRGNVPDPVHGLLAGTNGIFDPNLSHSGSAGRSRGGYVLNLQVVSDSVPPRVVAVTPGAGSFLAAPPTSLTVTFDEPVNLQQLAFAAYQRGSQGSLTSVYVEGTSGVQYYPRLQSYDPATGQATFLMLDRLPPGRYALHLSGPQGLADLASNPLTGNDPGGDYVLGFTVGGPAVPSHADQEPNDDPARPQDLGVLFPHELQGSGYAITREFSAHPSAAPADSADGYRFEVLQARTYLFYLGGSGLPAGVRLTLTDAAGGQVAAKAQADGVSLQAFLQPGAYVVRVSGWDPTSAARVAYSLRVVLGGSPENPQPLTLGPAPVLRLSLAPSAPAGPAATPRLAIPAGGAAPAKAAATGVVPAAATTGPGAPVAAPSGLLAALGAGPVGGVGADTGGGPAAAPFLLLGGAVRAASPASVSLTSESGSRLSETVAAILRFIDIPRWWETFLNEFVGPGYEDEGPARSEEVIPLEEEAGGAETARAPDSEEGAAGPTAAACLATLACVVARPAGGRRRQTATHRGGRHGDGAATGGRGES